MFFSLGFFSGVYCERVRQRATDPVAFCRNQARAVCLNIVASGVAAPYTFNCTISVSCSLF